MDSQTLLALLAFAQREAPLVQQAIRTAEALFSTPGSGAEKLAFVLQVVQAAEGFKTALEGTPGGKELISAAGSALSAVLNFLGGLVSSVVTHLFPHHPPAAAPAQR